MRVNYCAALEEEKPMTIQVSSYTQINLGRDHGRPDDCGPKAKGDCRPNDCGDKGRDEYDGMNLCELRDEMKEAKDDFHDAMRDGKFGKAMKALKQMNRIREEIREEKAEKRDHHMKAAFHFLKAAAHHRR